MFRLDLFVLLKSNNMCEFLSFTFVLLSMNNYSWLTVRDNVCF